MDDFITSEALAISPELKLDRVNTLNKLVTDNKYIVVTNLNGALRYLPTKELWKKNIINIKVGDDINREELVNKLYHLGYETETLVTQTGKIGRSANDKRVADKGRVRCAGLERIAITRISVVECLTIIYGVFSILD